jgi:hypothetical protein
MNPPGAERNPGPPPAGDGGLQRGTLPQQGRGGTAAGSRTTADAWFVRLGLVGRMTIRQRIFRLCADGAWIRITRYADQVPEAEADGKRRKRRSKHKKQADKWNV